MSAMITDLLFVVFVLVCCTAVSILWAAWRYGIGPVPTSRKVKQALLEVLPPSIEGNIYELGAGWGTLAFALAKRYPQNLVIALEISYVPWLYMRLRQLWSPEPNLQIQRIDFFTISFEPKSLIVCYLYPKSMTDLEKKIHHSSHSLQVLTHTFALPHTAHQMKSYATDLYHTPIYFYQFDKIFPGF